MSKSESVRTVRVRNLDLAVKQMTRLFANIPEETRQAVAEEIEADLSGLDDEALQVKKAKQTAYNYLVAAWAVASGTGGGPDSDLSREERGLVLDEMVQTCQSPNSKTKYEKAFGNDEALDSKSVKAYQKGVTDIINAVKVTLAGLDSAIEQLQEERDLTKHSEFTSHKNCRVELSLGKFCFRSIQGSDVTRPS